MASNTPAAMSDYERAAWQALLGEADKQHHRSHRVGDWVQGIKGRATQAATTARAVVERAPGAEAALGAMDATITNALEGIHTVLIERGLNSVSPASVFAMFAGEGTAVGCYADIGGLDLNSCDRSVPWRKERYIALAVTEGVASSLAAGGATVTTTVSGGTTAALAVSAIVADVTTVLVGMGRIVAVVAAHYGYDVREPDEQVFASGVLAYSSASNSAEKAAALASLSRLTQQMRRRATGQPLQQHQTANVIQQISTALGFRMVKRKLAQAVPVLGAVFNGGLNARIAAQTFDRARQAYRLRFLTEKYDLDPARWAPPVVDAEPTEVPLVDEVLDAELARERSEH